MRRPPVSAVSVLATAVVVFVVAVVTVVVLTVRGGDDPSGPAAGGGAADAGTPAVTTLAELAAADVVVRRDAFCDAVDTGAVATALGADLADTTAASYDNGDLLPTDAVPGTGASVQAVAHEYGCSWTATDATVARAWVFAPPVATGRATRLARAAERAEGCAAHTAEPFGDPTAAWTCTDPAGATTAGRGGLFGDAWLSCTLTATGTTLDPTDLQARADSWCVAAADAAAGSAG